MTWPTRHVLAALATDPTGQHYGLDLARRAALRPGTIYPILARLEGRGWITGEWEKISPSIEGRRPRRYYRLTAAGFERAREAQAELSAIVKANPGLLG